MMKRFSRILIFFVLAVFLWAANAFSYTIDDNTLVRKIRSGGGTVYGDWIDVIGNPDYFDVFGIDVTFSGGNMTLDLYSNINSDGHRAFSADIDLYIADIALDVNQDGTYEHGIVLKRHADWTGVPPILLGLEVGVYSVNSWHTSSDFINPISGYSYGGEWDDAATAGDYPRDPIVAINDVGGNPIKTGDATVLFTDIGGDDPNYKWSVTIATSSLGDLGGAIDIFWGGMTCANDPIQGTAPVPEPATMLLFGTGLIGMAAIGRRKFRKR